MKKITLWSVLLILCTMMIFPAYADDNGGHGGGQLLMHGFISGDGQGLAPDRRLTRAEMTVILSELLGEKTQAQAYTYPANFTDVSNHWAKSYIAYGQEKAWFGGFPDGSYRPEGTVSAQALSAFLLNALGYSDQDYTYDYAQTYLENLGVSVADSEALTRGQAFDAIWQAVQLPPKGEVVPLGISLGKINYEDLDQATSDDLKIVSFKSINLFEYQIRFNQPVDKMSAENSQHYTLKSPKNTSIAAARAEFILSEDGQTVTFYMPMVNPNDRMTLRAEGIETADGLKALESTEMLTTATDQTAPQVLEAEIIGSKVIRFTFSEALKLSETDIQNAFNAGNFTSASSVAYPLVNGQRYHVADVSFHSDFSNNSLMALSVGPISDEADLKSQKKSFSLKVERDRTAPEVIAYELIDRNRLGLIWSKPISLVDGDASKFYHTNESNLSDTVSMKLGTNNETVLYFNSKTLPLQAGYVYVKEGAVKDLWNNRNTFSMTPFTFDLNDLIPVPQRIDVVDSRRIKVNFSTPINETHETSPANFTLLKGGKEVIVPMSLSFDPVDKDSITIAFSSELKGDYSLVIEGVKHYDLPSEKATLKFMVE